jgi:hypothetical protein
MQQEQMVTQTPSGTERREPWRIVWQIATGDSLLVILLLAVAVGLLVTAWLPQAPTSGPAAYARWLSETQARFGRATQTMQALGLFGVARSFGFRTLLVSLGGVLLLRLVEYGERSFSNADVHGVLNPFPLLAHAGGLLLLIGLFITHLWGWQVEGLIVQGGERVSVPGTASWVALDGDTLSVEHSAGIVAFAEARGPGVRVSASDAEGNPLVLQRAKDAPLTKLTLPLTEDRLFAIPEAQLIVRLAPQAGHTVEAPSPLIVQIYRYPPVRLETESTVEEDAELTLDDARLHLTHAPYARVTATFNPGLWPTGVGIALAAVGLGGRIVWSVRRPKTGEED